MLEKIIIGFVLSAISLTGCYVAYDQIKEVGRKEIRAEWDKAKAAQALEDKAAIFTRVKNNERIAAEQEATNKQLKDSHAKEIVQIRARAASDSAYRLRIPASVCSGFASGAKAEGSAGSNSAVAGTVVLPDETEKNLRGLMVEADLVTAGCRVSQDFIKNNGMAP
jgi:hypothetical protein